MAGERAAAARRGRPKGTGLLRIYRGNSAIRVDFVADLQQCAAALSRGGTNEVIDGWLAAAQGASRSRLKYWYSDPMELVQFFLRTVRFRRLNSGNTWANSGT